MIDTTPHYASAPAVGKQTNLLASLIAVLLAVGALFGMAGTFVPTAEARQVLWMIDGVALVVATALLTMRYLDRAMSTVAAGFLVYLAGQALVLSHATANLTQSNPSFIAGIALWSAGLILLGFTPAFPKWSRWTGFAAAGIFLITTFRAALGDTLLPIDNPFPGLGYPLMIATYVGWALTMLRDEKEA